MSGHRIEYAVPVRQRRPRIKEPQHLDNIRQLPCLICFGQPVEAAHLRAKSNMHGKRETGKSEKPSDKWALPLCPEHHREQHSMNELGFWRYHGIDPFVTALSLWAAEGDIDSMEFIVSLAARR